MHKRVTRSSATTEIARIGGHYAVHGHSRSLILIQSKVCMWHWSKQTKELLHSY